jgi:hypothetical protein
MDAQVQLMHNASLALILEEHKQPVQIARQDSILQQVLAVAQHVLRILYHVQVLHLTLARPIIIPMQVSVANARPIQRVPQEVLQEL